MEITCLAKGIATRSKDATRGSWPYYKEQCSLLGAKVLADRPQKIGWLPGTGTSCDGVRSPFEVACERFSVAWLGRVALDGPVGPDRTRTTEVRWFFGVPGVPVVLWGTWPDG